MLPAKTVPENIAGAKTVCTAIIADAVPFFRLIACDKLDINNKHTEITKSTHEVVIILQKSRMEYLSHVDTMCSRA